MNIAVLLYKYIDNPRGVPGFWPAEILEIGKATKLPGPNWQLMTKKEFIEYKKKYQSKWDEWKQNTVKYKLSRCHEERKHNYRSLEEQLDMLWHAVDEGKLDKSSEFYKHIKEVKDKYPKP